MATVEIATISIERTKSTTWAMATFAQTGFACLVNDIPRNSIMVTPTAQVIFRTFNTVIAKTNASSLHASHVLETVTDVVIRKCLRRSEAPCAFLLHSS